MPMTLVFDLPPSVNTIYAGLRRRYSSKQYIAWQRTALIQISMQKPTSFNGVFFTHISMERLSKLSDANNRIKPILDILQKAKVIGNDNNEGGTTADWVSYMPDKKGSVPRCFVTLFRTAKERDEFSLGSKK